MKNIDLKSNMGYYRDSTGKHRHTFMLKVLALEKHLPKVFVLKGTIHPKGSFFNVSLCVLPLMRVFFCTWCFLVIRGRSFDDAMTNLYSKSTDDDRTSWSWLLINPGRHPVCFYSAPVETEMEMIRSKCTGKILLNTNKPIL